MGLLEDLFSFVSRKRFLNQKLQESQALKAFILEPILTPSGLVDDPTHDTGFIIIDPNPGIDHSLDFPPDAHPELDHAPVVDFHLSTAAIAPEHIELLPFIHDPEPAIPNVEHLFDSGIFTVGESGKVSIDYLFDGGGYQGQLAIFNLKGMEGFDLNTETGLADFIHEAAHRALSNSDLGHVVIADATEGAKFSGLMPSEWQDHNFGQYQGVKTFDMEVGDKFAVILVPNGTVQQVLDGNQDADIRPLFSLHTVNPNEAFHAGQIADVTGDGNTFVLEDLRTDHWTDRDYNDIIFQVRGATGTAAHLDDVINPELDWRHSDVGQELIAYAHAQIEPVNPHPALPEVPVANHPLIGIIDTGFSANNPDINYSHIILGHDYIDGDSNPLLSSEVGNEHGTHVLGIIGATQDNGIGIDGINDDAPIWVSRAVGSGHWSDSLVEFVDAAKASHQPNAVVNLSLDLTQINHDGSITTRYEFTPLERAAIEYARQNHVLIVAAAGNDGGVMSVLGQASQEFDNIITVGAADGLERAEYSSYGSGLDILAPGGTSENPILSAVGDGVGTMAGTSVAAAEVTGAISQVWAANPDLSYRQVIEILKSTATDLDAPGWDAETGSGLLNLVAAVSVARTVVPEDFIPLPWITPETWSGAGVVTPEERAASGGNSIATATIQSSPNFVDKDKVDASQLEKYYKFTVNESGYFRWNLSSVNPVSGFPNFPKVTVVKADGNAGAYSFTKSGSITSSSGIAEGQSSITNGVFIDPGTYYLKVSGNTATTVKNYNISTNLIPDRSSTASGLAQFFTQPYSSWNNSQSKLFSGQTASVLNISEQVKYDTISLDNRIDKYGIEVKEPGTLTLNLNSLKGKIGIALKKFIGSENEPETLVNYQANGNANQQFDFNLNKGRYQIEITTPSNYWQEPDWNATQQTLTRPYTLNGVFYKSAPQPGQGGVPISAGSFVKTSVSNGVTNHYYTNGYLTVQPSGQAIWYGYGTPTPSVQISVKPITDPDGDGSISQAKQLFDAVGGVVLDPKNISSNYKTTKNGSIGGTDLNDYYKFSLDEARRISLVFDGLGYPANLQLIQDLNNNGQIDAGEVLKTGGVSGKNSVLLDNILGKGTYYVRVYPGQSGITSNYRLDATNNSLENQPIADFNGNYYLVQNGQLRFIPNQETLKAIVPNLNTVKYFPNEDLNRLPWGNNLPSRKDGAVFTDLSGRIYLMESGKRRLVPDWATLKAIGINITGAPAFPDSDLKDIPLGEPYFLTNHWKASFINRNSGNIAQVYSINDFNNPAATLDLGVQGSGDGKISLKKSWGLNSPDNRVQIDNFAMQASTRTYLQANKLYKVTTKSDDGTRFLFKNVKTGVVKTIEELGGWTDGDWRDRGATEPQQTIYFKVPDSGDYDFYVQYYDKGAEATVDVSLEENKPFQEPYTGSEWNSTFFWWDETKGNIPPGNFYKDTSNIIGTINLGSNQRPDGKKGIQQDWGNNSPNRNTLIPKDNFAVRSYTQAYFEEGKTYRVRAKADDGFQLLAKRANTSDWVYITPQDQWQQSYNDYKDYTLKVSHSGMYDFHFHHFENGGAAKIDLSWEEVSTSSTIDLPSGSSGIDVSNNNGYVDWQKVRNAGNLFAFVKATEGTGYTYNHFSQNLQDIRQVGMRPGAYHFFVSNVNGQEVSGEEQANYFLNAVGNIGKDDFPPVLDLEEYDNKPEYSWNNITLEARLKLVKQWLETIEKKTGRKPIIYTNTGFWRYYMGNSKDFAEYPLWIANYNDVSQPDVPGGWNNYAIWQYSKTGRVDGVSGNVDLNKFSSLADPSSNPFVNLPSSGTELPLEQANSQYFLDRPEFYTTGNNFYSFNAPVSVGGTGGLIGNCTWYAYGRVKQLGGNEDALKSMNGDAGTWGDNLSYGAKIVEIPEPGDIAEWTDIGHVAVVEQVNQDGTIVVSQSNHYALNPQKYSFLHHSADTIPYSELGLPYPNRFIRVPKV